MKTFASDNFSGVHPEVLLALAEANVGHAMAYGADPLCKKVREQFSELFEQYVEVFFAFNGTGANNIALRAGLSPWGRVVCSDCAHLVCDESTAPASFLGCLVSTVPACDGKILLEHLHGFAKQKGNVHQAQPQMLTLTQSSECGTVYSCAEIAALCEFAHAHGMFVHIDGARIANAVAFSGVSPKQMFGETGVDVISFGGTKNGGMFGEAVVFLNTKLAENFSYIHKMGMQLPSKSRFVASQFHALLKNELWLRIAKHSNAMAQIFATEARKRNSVKILYPVQANAVFAELSIDLAARLKEKAFFWEWSHVSAPEGRTVARFMTTFDTTEDEILSFWNGVD